VEFKTEKKEIEVPEIDVDVNKKKTTIEVPDVDFHGDDDEMPEE